VVAAKLKLNENAEYLKLPGPVRKFNMPGDDLLGRQVKAFNEENLKEFAKRFKSEIACSCKSGSSAQSIEHATISDYKSVRKDLTSCSKPDT
jgi:hypothetical protein